MLLGRRHCGTVLADGGAGQPSVTELSSLREDVSVESFTSDGL
jgi:hypothetical protein